MSVKVYEVNGRVRLWPYVNLGENRTWRANFSKILPYRMLRRYIKVIGYDTRSETDRRTHRRIDMTYSRDILFHFAKRACFLFGEISKWLQSTDNYFNQALHIFFSYYEMMKLDMYY
jgi:hypothetical protein